LERIVNAHWSGGGPGVVFRDVHQHDACNHTLSGTINIGGRVFGFIVRNGNNDGTEVVEWGDADDIGIYEPPPPGESLTSLPTLNIYSDQERRIRGLTIYALWRKEPWFVEQARKYAYDRHFQPGGFVESHYREWAEKKGVRIGLFSSLSAADRAVITEVEARHA
jgi:hypothetical protein